MFVNVVLPCHVGTLNTRRATSPLGKLVGGGGRPLTTYRMFSFEIGVEPNKIVLSHACDEAHFWLNGYVNKQNCRIWSEANPQVYVETPLHPEKLTVWCASWAGGILLQKR
ncbi:hypothetical protein TNCV_3938371 [Trichonephila clavipes]|nr:hypothetical protein TNCV_3938371 [Trichonephila clavipes]